MTLLPIDTVTSYVDPAVVHQELLGVIADAITAHPRSQQTAIGASEVGHACAKRIGYKLAGVPERNHQPPPWRPTVGTAVHAWLADVFEAANISDGYIEEESGRWLTEKRLVVGRIGADPVWGTCDLYDRATGFSIDWKVVGRTTLRKAKAGHIDDAYRYQGHIYGRGRQARGFRVNGVMAVFLPSAGELSESVFWAEPFDPDMAAKAFDRADGINTLVTGLGAAAALPMLPRADAHCAHCPWFLAAGDGGEQGCSGADEIRRQRPDLLGPTLRKAV